MKSYAELLALPGQRRLAFASVPADFADWLDYLALISLVVYSWQHGPWALAFLTLAFTLPHIVVGPFLAAITDRADLRAALLLSNLGRAVLTLALVAAPNLEILLIIVFVRGIVDSAFTPARQATLQLITPQPLLTPANGLHQAINQTSKIAGPALGGLLVALTSPQNVFVLNAGLSLLAVAILWGIRLPPRRAATPANEAFLARMFAGFAEFLGNRRLLSVLIFTSSAWFAFFLYDTLIALLSRELGYDAAAFGLSIAASGAGGLLGSLAAGLLPGRRPLLLMAGAALVCGPLTVGLAVCAALGIAIDFRIFVCAMAAMGGSSAFMLVPYRTVIQAETPPERIARVYSAGEAVTVSVMMAAPFVGSAIASAFGVPAAFIAGGALLVVIGIVAIATTVAGPK